VSHQSLTVDLNRAARRTRGKQATLTFRGREQALARFARLLWSAGFQIHTAGQVKEKHIVAWTDAMKARGCSRRTIANNLAHVRTALEGIKRRRFADKMSNAVLSIANASRDGTKEPMSREMFEAFVTDAQKEDPGVAMVLELEFELGCRAQEGVMSPKSLKDWERILASPMTDGFVDVIHGTKGGRSRRSPPVDRTRALDVVRRALALSDQYGGVLVRKPDLEKAMHRYHYIVRKIGMVRERAPHSLRYAYATEHLERMRRAGVSRKEASAAVSTFLGHGDGRGTWVQRVYGRKSPTTSEE
jgi:site-specific recombinase XerD